MVLNTGAFFSLYIFVYANESVCAVNATKQTHQPTNQLSQCCSLITAGAGAEERQVQEGGRGGGAGTTVGRKKAITKRTNGFKMTLNRRKDEKR